MKSFDDYYCKVPSGCWEWVGAKDSTGYCKYNSNLAHRVSYTCDIGRIPEGLLICHKCDNRGCVNPAHLYAGTAKDNVYDTSIDGQIGKVSEGFKSNMSLKLWVNIPRRRLRSMI